MVVPGDKEGDGRKGVLRIQRVIEIMLLDRAPDDLREVHRVVAKTRRRAPGAGQVPPSIKLASAASSSTATPSFSALVSFEPAFSPAIR